MNLDWRARVPKKEIIERMFGIFQALDANSEAPIRVGGVREKCVLAERDGIPMILRKSAKTMRKGGRALEYWVSNLLPFSALFSRTPRYPLDSRT